MPFDYSKFQERAERATAALRGTSLGPVRWVAETGSTNSDLLAAGVAGASHGLILVADHQTSGRGRRDRTWTAAPGEALLMSVLLRPSIGGTSLGAVTAAVAVGAAEQCLKVGCEGVQIKWPNDLVVGVPGAQRKLGGILAQSQLAADSTVVVVGLGLNLVGAHLGEHGTGAIALDEIGPVPDVVDLVVGLSERVSGWLGQVDQGLIEALWERYRALSATLGTRVIVTQDRGTVEGMAVDITPSGALVVHSGVTSHEIVVGDVVSLRPQHGHKPQ